MLSDNEVSDKAAIEVCSGIVLVNVARRLRMDRVAGRLTGPHTSAFVIIKENAMDYRDRLIIEPGKMGGKPCIRGLRITVYDVLDYMRSGMTKAEILEDFPDLTAEDLEACLAFDSDRERRLTSIPA